MTSAGVEGQRRCFSSETTPATATITDPNPTVLQDEKQGGNSDVVSPADDTTTAAAPLLDSSSSNTMSFITLLMTTVLPFCFQFLLWTGGVLGSSLMRTVVIVGYCFVHEERFFEKSTVPPALIGIALLSIVALFVHPDGLTWILMRSLRDGLFLFLRSCSTLWSVVVLEYGTILSTLLALCTFACLFFVAFLMRQTLKSKTHLQNAPKKAARHHHKRKKNRQKEKGRIRGSRQKDETSSTTTAETVLPSLSEDKPSSFAGPTLPLLEEKLSSSSLVPDCVDSVASSIDEQGGGSTSTSNHDRPSVVTTTTTTLSKSSSSRTNKSGASRSSSKVSERQSLRRHKSENTSQQRAPPLRHTSSDRVVPSKRWDALKPSARSRNTTTHRPPKSLHNSKPRTEQRRPEHTTILSDLNPETPAWTMTSATPNITTAPTTTTNRFQHLPPPPGIPHPSFKKEVPFGCSSTDEDDTRMPYTSSNNNDVGHLLRQLEMMGSLDTAAPPPPQHDDDDDAMIEAELQLLGGQMVGSILDF